MLQNFQHMKKLIPIIALITLLLSSCEGWLDINTDPNNPSTIKLNKVLPGINKDLGDILGNSYMDLGYITSVYVHQLTSRESIDQYGINGNDMNTVWSNLYTGPIKELETFISTAVETDNLIYAGIGKLYKAFIYSQMVDIWGDVPFSEAVMLENYDPKFDKDVEIYGKLFTLIDDAIANLQNQDAENEFVPKDDDIIYKGNVTKWVKLANTLKLKMYVQVMNTSLYNQSAVDALISGDLIGTGEDFSIPYGTSQAPDNRNPGFVDEYAGGQISSYISPWFWEILNGKANHIFKGIQDPRIPYYICTQLSETGEPENPAEYRDGNFVSIYFGSQGVFRDGAGRNTYAMIGLYSVGGAYDTTAIDKSKMLDVSSGTGAAPLRLITYTDLLFLKAELIAKNKIAGDLKEALELAINEAFVLVDAVTASAGKGTEPKLVGKATVTDYITSVLAEFDAGNDEKKFEIVMTQKWISKFGSAIDSYTDYRRTGYPVLFDPETMASVATGGPDGNGPVPVQLIRPYAVSFPWSSDELSLNDNAPSQKSPATHKIFWDN
jgi:hypothetical protein